MRRKMIAIVTALAMVLSLLPMGALPGWAEEGDVTAGENQYIDRQWDESSQTVVSTVEDIPSNAIEINANNKPTSWTAGWYVVRGNVEISGQVTVTGNVNLILADGASLNVSYGITQDNGNRNLTIYAQSHGAQQGVLVASGGNYYRGISIHTLTINGGAVTAIGGESYEGGEEGINADSITLNAGAVVANGGKGGGITSESSRGGNAMSASKIAIHGGFVTAIGGAGMYGPVIYGINGSGIVGTATVEILGGQITSTGYDGIISENGAVTIAGGSVTATGKSDNGKGISGKNVIIKGNSHVTAQGKIGISADNVEISSGVVESSKISGSFSTTAQGYAVIVATAIEDNQDTSAWHGIIFQGSNGKVYGDISLAQDLSTPEGSTLEIEQGTTLRIEKDAALTNSTTLVNKGTIQVDGLLINSGTVRNEGSIEYSGTIQNDGLFYSAENGVTSDNGTFTGNSIKDLSDLGLLLNKKYLLKEENGARYYSEDGGTSWTAYTGTISFWGGSSEGCIEVQSGTHDIILNNVTAGNGKAACIDTGANSRSNTRVTLVGNNTINGCIYVRNGTTFEITEESTGQLDIIANGTNYNPPIGAGFREQPGVINIHGGTVTVEVLKSYGLEGAIGPGQWGSANAISIKNSTVVVKGTAGTGGPSSLCGSRITMENANVIVADKVKGTVDAINSLVKTEGSKLTAYDYTLMEDMTVEKDTTLTIPEGKMLTIPEGVTLTLEEGATLENNGTIICYGTIDGDVSGEVRYASQVDVNIAGLTDGKAAYGSTITVTATMTKKPATTNSLSAEVGKVDFYLGDTTGQPLASADVNDNHGNYTATMKLTLDDETWAKGFRMGENTIIADFGGIAGSADKEGLATSTGRATLTVVQGEQEAPAKPEKEDVASDSVVLKTLETSSQGTVVEYGYKTASEQEVSHWQTVKAAFEGLLPGTTYTFYARYKGNDYYKPSNISEGTEITTLPIITTSSLAAGKVGIEYNKGQLSVTSQEPVEWTISDGTLPEGLSLDKSTGEISGTPTKTGTYHFTVQATIKDDISASQTMSIEIEPGTPAFTGVTVKNGDDVSNAFTYGDTITVSGKIITDSTTKRRNTLKTNQVGLYLNADDAPLATANVGADGSFELRYTIADQDKLLPKEGKQTLMLKYSGSDNLTEGTTTVEITVGKAKQDPPVKGDGYSIDFKNEIIAASESYELATSDQATTGEQSLTVTPGANVFVRLAESKTHYASDWTEVDIPARPPAPKNVVGSVNTLSGLSTDMEYSRDGKSWAEVKGTSMELTAGDYYVRYKAMTDNFASESVKVTVKPYSGKYSYETTVTQPEHGKITVDKYVTEGENVTITVTPDKGYEVDKVTVTDKNGKTVDVTKNADGTYSFTMPKSNVTITATLVESDEPAPEPQPSALPFTDVSADAWYIDPVRFVYSEGLMTGTSATTFSPNLTTTRGMIVAILYRMEGEPDLSGENLGYPFADVDASAYYGDAVYWARMNGIVSGYSSDAFGPTDSITREQLAAILYNYAEYKGVDVSARNDLSDNTDAGSISGWATDAMQWANAAGIVSGMSATELAPKGNATRAQVAAMLQRYITNVIN